MNAYIQPAAAAVSAETVRRLSEAEQIQQPACTEVNMKALRELIFSSNSRTQAKADKLEESLVAFSKVTGVPVTFFSSSGRLLWTTSEQTKICNANKGYPDLESQCMATLLSAMNISLNIGDVYTFKCNSDLINLSYPVIIEKKLHGFMIAGPAAMGMKMEKVLLNFAKKIPEEQMDYPYLLTLINDLKLCEPREIAYITTLFVNSIRAPLEYSASGNVKQQQQEEQNIISSKIVHIKKAHLEVEYPYKSEQELSRSIRSGSTDTCQRLFSKYMEDIIVFEGGNLAIIKLRLISFLTQLLKSSDTWQRDYSRLGMLDDINRSSTLREMTEAGSRLINAMVEAASEKRYSGSSAIIKKAVAYIHANYTDQLTLKSIADEIHVSNTYLSALFHREMGISAIDYLTNLRLEHSSELLHDASLSIADVSASSGFTSQSYFTKLFKEKYGMTPNAYRKKACGE